MPKLQVYTIAYTPELLNTIEEGFLPLDNSENARPDWREYWPMRQFLKSHTLEDDCYYGFFSPKFTTKSGLSYQKLQAFIDSAPKDTDVFVISPQVDIGAFFQNEYYGGDLMSPGFLDTSQKVLDRNNIQISLGDLFTDSRTTSFSNFVVARASYWEKWLAIGEMYFEIAEKKDGSDVLTDALNIATVYSGNVPRKVFVIEALASLILNLYKELKVHVYDPFMLPTSQLLVNYKTQSILCDALKTAFIESGRNAHRDQFTKISREVLSESRLLQNRPYMVKDIFFDQHNPILLDLIPDNAERIVDLGCGRAGLAKQYKLKNPNAYWFGVDIDADFIEAAKFNCDETLCTDLEDLTLEALKQFADYDCWILGDILGCLKNPWAVLSRIKKAMKPTACLILSVRNAQHWSCQARLNAGLLPYDDQLVVETNHIRQFTQTSLLEMIANAGLQMDQGVSQLKNSPEMEKYLDVIRAMAAISQIDPNVATASAMPFVFNIRALPARIS